MADFIFLGSKITVDGDCSHEIKRRLLLGRKVMTNLDSIFMYGFLFLQACDGVIEQGFLPGGEGDIIFKEERHLRYTKQFNGDYACERRDLPCGIATAESFVYSCYYAFH